MRVLPHAVLQPAMRRSPRCATNGQSVFGSPGARHGRGLADGVSQGQAGPREFRTAPLWGLGQRIFFLHDGRTSDLVAAIRAHQSTGSEANGVVGAFQAPERQPEAGSPQLLAVALRSGGGYATSPIVSSLATRTGPISRRTLFAALAALLPVWRRLAGQELGVGMLSVEGEGARYWTRWRGPSGQGLAAGSRLCRPWSATENVLWKVAGSRTPATRRRSCGAIASF